MDLNLNHSGDMLEDLLGNDKEITLHLRDAMKQDSRARFRVTAILGGLIGAIGIILLFFPFIPGLITLWLMGMAVGMFLAGLFGMLLSMPVIDSVGVHLKVIDYVDNVIKNVGYRARNLMDETEDEEDSEEAPEEEEEEEEDDEDEEEEEGTD